MACKRSGVQIPSAPPSRSEGLSAVDRPRIPAFAQQMHSNYQCAAKLLVRRSPASARATAPTAWPTGLWSAWRPRWVLHRGGARWDRDDAALPPPGDHPPARDDLRAPAPAAVGRSPLATPRSLVPVGRDGGGLDVLGKEGGQQLGLEPAEPFRLGGQGALEQGAGAAGVAYAGDWGRAARTSRQASAVPGPQRRPAEATRPWKICSSSAAS
jgi:hypothetical protein